MTADPTLALAQRRKDFEDAMVALNLDEPAKLALRAAASALAKAKAIAVLATFSHSGRDQAEAQVSV